jgi:cation diffusion facilitator family transporter
MRIPKLDVRILAMAASLLIAVVMLVGKLWAYWLTGSSAIFSDALESVIHLGATGFAAWSLAFSAQPADPDHPYGHGKAAYFSAGFEGTLIGVAALSILGFAISTLLHPSHLQYLGLGIYVIGFLACINLGLGLTLVRVGQARNVLVLTANGQHVLADTWTSAGVVVGILAVVVTGWSWLDPVVAIGVALNILWSAAGLLKTSFRGLMDHADAEDTLLLTACLEAALLQELVAGYHQLRHRRVNDELQVEAHLLFPGDASLTQAHDAASEVERRIVGLFPGDRVRVMTHLEPVEHDAAHPEGHYDFPDPILGVATDAP